MKHLTICLVCLVLIGFYTAFSYMYINSFTSDVESEIKFAAENNYPMESVNKINDIFLNKKSTLNFLVNTDHIDVFKDALAEFEGSVKYGDYQSAEINGKLLLNIIENINENNKNVI